MLNSFESYLNRLRLIIDAAEQCGRSDVENQYRLLLFVYEQIASTRSGSKLTESDLEELEHWLAMTDPKRVVVE